MVKNYIVSGRVQGVGFRYFTKTRADQLGIVGWVRNLKNGDVECQAMGSVDLLEKFETLLNQGPSHAQVEQVIVKTVDEQENIMRDFLIRH